MNAKNVLGLLLISSLALTSCKKDLEPQESSVATEITTPSDNSADQMQPAAANGQPQTIDPSQMQQVAQPQMQQSQPAQVAAGMNPAHGQPNHRCDIAVGAPLNSPPGNTAKQVTPQQVTPQQTPPVSMTAPSAPAMLPSAPVVTAPGMNPPHGQEGHQCGVAVGAPLPKV